MAVPVKQSVPINFSGGLDLKTDPKQINPGKFLALNNSVFTTGGQLTKRNGFGSLGTTIVNAPTLSSQAYSSAVAAGRTISAYNNELVLNDGFNTFSYLEDVDGWNYKGKNTLCSVSTASVYNSANTVTYSDSAINYNLGQKMFVFWNFTPGSNSVSYSVIDLITSEVIKNYTIVSIYAEAPKCFAVGSFFYILVLNSSSGFFDLYKYGANGFISSTASFINDNNAVTSLDVIVVGTTVYVGYNGSGSNVKIRSYDSSMSAIAAVAKSDIAPNGLSLFSDGTNIWCAYGTGSAVNCFIMSLSLGVTVKAPYLIDNSALAVNTRNVTGCYDGNQGVIFYDQIQNATVGQQIVFVTIGSSTLQPAVGSSVVVTSNTAVTSNALWGGQIVALTYPSGTPQVLNTVGYYRVSSWTTTTLTLTNLGMNGSIAVGATIPVNALMTINATVGNLDLISVTGFLNYANSNISVNTSSVAASVGTPLIYMNSVSLASKAFAYNGIAHVSVLYSDSVQPSYFLTNLYNYVTTNAAPIGNVVSTIFSDEAGGIVCESALSAFSYNVGLISVLPQINKRTDLSADGIFELSLLKRNVITAKTYIPVDPFYPDPILQISANSGVYAVDIDFTVKNPSTAFLGNNLLTGSGVVNSYDGANVSEQNFLIYPENVILVQGTTLGALTLSSTYGYIAVYEWVDNKGNIVQSTPSPATSITLPSSGNNSIGIMVPTLRVTGKQNVNIVIYRTIANGSIYYRLSTITNNPLSNYGVVTDYASDASIQSNQQLYTTGALPDVAPPSGTIMSTFKNRVMVVDSENPTDMWYSKQVLSGSPVEFVLSFVQNIGTAGGNLTGVYQMDDKLILFKAGSLLYMVGTGPTASGSGNDFTDPLPVAFDAGCVDSGSIVLMPLGLMFKSAKGIYLLDRGLNSSYIGADVEKYNANHVLSSQLIPNSTQVRFLLDNGITLFYDYYYKQWGTFSIGGVSDCIFQGQHTIVAGNGTVYKETPGVYLDGANPVLMNFTTSWIKFAGLQGYQRAFFFYLLAEYISPHSLSFGIAYDFSSSLTQVSIITPDPTNNLENWRVFLAQQRCQAFQIQLQEVYGGTPGAGFTMSGLNLIVGAKSQFTTIAAAQSVG
jgi:hypothetical protein